jgi:predicted ATP-grasp superfamily ATP-dependent carboligase
MKSEIENILVVGFDTVAVAASAKRAGYTVYAANYFGDTDLQRFCSKYTAVIKQAKGKSCGRIASNYKPEAFLEMAKSLSRKYRIDGLLLSSGLDDAFHVLQGLSEIVPITGNSPEVIQNVREKRRFFDELKLLEVPHPKTLVVNDVSEAKVAAEEIGYPVVVKPASGFGGASIRLANSAKEIEKVFSDVAIVDEDFLVQEFIRGVHASMSILATSKNVEVLSINEQLLGLPLVFQCEQFGYCGNIVPLQVKSATLEKCKDIAEKIALHFCLKGSNGIDMVISKSGTPYVIEVNPRFQGTLECVERVLGINIVEWHVKACMYDMLPQVKSAPSAFCTRLILYAPKRVLVPNLTVFHEARDIPHEGSIVEEGEPLCSILTIGRKRGLSFKKAEKIANNIYSGLVPA